MSTPPSVVPLRSILRVFLVIGLTALGGGASAHIHEAVVHREGWIDEKRFVEGMTVARIVPGTNVSNLAAFVGSMLAGYRGAAVAVLAVVVPGTVVMLALAVSYARFASGGHIQTALHGLTAGAVGIMASLVINAAGTALRSHAELLFAVAAFVGVGVLELNMLWVLAALVPLASFVNRDEGSK
jgi:chromate transporter